MFAFLRRKKYRLGKRIVIIENRSKAIKFRIKRIRKIIIEIFQAEPIFSKFPRLVIILWDTDMKQVASAFNPDIIYVNVAAVTHGGTLFDTRSDTAIYDELKPTMIHEMVHLVHYSRNKGLMMYKERYTRQVLGDIVRLMKTKSFETTIEQSSKSLRTTLNVFLSKIWMEGAARFLQNLYVGRLKFDEDNFRRLHAAAESLVRQAGLAFELINEALAKNVLIDTNALNKFLQKAEAHLAGFAISESYVIGEHIFFSIRYFDSNIDDDNLLDMHIYDIVRKYERLMLKNGYLPVLSLYSGSGIFDYKRNILTLAHFLKKAQQN